MSKLYSISIVGFSLIPLYGLGSGNFSKKEVRPNVIVILSDDQGYGDFSCLGNPILKTPALDKLYNESIRFSNFHVAPLSTPSRGQLMTGLDALNNKASTVLFARNLMRRDIVTMPQVFKMNGYQTAIFGKWHLGDTYPDRPMDRGFQKCVWFKGWGLQSEMEFDNDHYKTRYLDSLETKQSDQYCTNLWFEKAMDWMTEKIDKKQPFFTYLALNAVHAPCYALKDDYDYYRNQVKDSVTASFFGMIRNMDQNMNRLDQWLSDKKIKDNTLLIFMNDNGGTLGVDVFNAGMKGKKGSIYEGGHRAVCFLRWNNGNFGKPRTISSSSEIQDVLPTFIDLLGLKVPENTHFDGESLKAVLKENKKLDDRMMVIQEGAPLKYNSCVVWNSWRLVGENELYDMVKDPGQKMNVAEQYPEIFRKMKDFYEDWWKKTEPVSKGIVPVVIGSDKENPVIISSNNWEDDAVNTQWNVALAKGKPTGGITYIHVESDGNYTIELSRWPFHLNRNLNAVGPKKAVGGTWIRPGKSIDVNYGCFSFDHQEPILEKSEDGATSIVFRMRVPAGDHTLQAWFKDKNKNDLCGAYYLRIKRD